MTVDEFITKIQSWLPLEREIIREGQEMRAKQTYISFIKDKLKEFYDLYKEIDRSEIDIFLVGYTNNLSNLKIANYIKIINKCVLQILQTYLDGFPGDAFKYLHNFFKYNKNINGRKLTYLDDMYVNCFQREITEINTLYRVRKSTTPIIKEDEMFHIPFNKIELVKSQRFSIPGYPCLYLGSNIETCCQEIGECSDGENYYTQSFKCSRIISLLSFRPLDINTANKMEKLNFILTIPFRLAALSKTTLPNQSFKPEYIIPQLIMQYVIKEEYLDGIEYPSTKFSPCDSKHINIVAYPKNTKSHLAQQSGILIHDTQLKALFKYEDKPNLLK